jgi:hypothetical protein
MFNVNAIITMKFNLNGIFKDEALDEISSLERKGKVLYKSDNNGYSITLVVKEPLEFDSYRDFVFDIDKRLEEYEENTCGASIKSVTFQDKTIIMNPYV